MKSLNRRKFFDRITKGALGAALIASLPVSLLGKQKNKINNVKVDIHKSAVKRNNRIAGNV
ncbi:MAG: hypothetical protein PVH88_10380 [Ignavibacteria bacterium]|jgi:hypothetical protein